MVCAVQLGRIGPQLPVRHEWRYSVHERYHVRSRGGSEPVSPIHGNVLRAGQRDRHLHLQTTWNQHGHSGALTFDAFTPAPASAGAGFYLRRVKLVETTVET